MGSIRQAVPILAIVIASALLPGCYVYHAYEGGGPEGREQGNQPSTEWKRKTLHSLAWGLVRQDVLVENCRLGNGEPIGIEEVRIRSNLGYQALTVLTLGFWSPVEVSWRCNKPSAPADTLR